jgi:hypothetical protein
MKIEAILRRYFAGLGYDGYPIRSPEGGMENYQIPEYRFKWE